MTPMQAAARQRRMLLTGNHAAAYGALLAKPQVIPVYPITPQTPVLEKLLELAEAGELTGEMITVESEHSGMAACISASLAGARVFTATASQGIALMHEMLHFAAGARTPVVMVNVNRTLASPWGFWADQTDSLSQRDTGWMQFYCESGQEALDTVLQAYRVAESVLLPAMVVIEAMYISHTLEPVEVPEAALVAGFLPPFEPTLRLDPGQPRSVGGVTTPAQWRQNRLAMQEAMTLALGAVAEAGRLYGELTGRAYGATESYRTEDAEVVLVAAGGMAGTAREAVDRLRQAGIAAGLLRLRLFRPFPGAEIAEGLAGAARVAVVDRNCSVGSGGIFCQEVRAALSSLGQGAVPVLSYIAGLGGVNVPPERMMRIVTDALGRDGMSAGPIQAEEL
ncbi:MAG: pyruvate ferredoxin oxidoreductase [Candidatus Rokubacteria bacterium]|nr:pyruvate ferredoxin oxidoreductase [Candidatus Rokubacteria bacterium]